MGLRAALGAVVLSLAAASVPAWAGAPEPRVDWRSATTVHGDLGPAVGSPQAWARDAAERLVDGRDLRVEQVTTSLIGTHVRGRQYRGALPVQGTDWLVTAIGRRVVQAEAHPTALPGRPVAAPIGTTAATAVALRHVRATALVVPAQVERLLVPRDGRLVDTYRVSLVPRTPVRAVTVEVAAADGRVLATGSDARHIDGSATLFDPSPVVTRRDSTLRQPLELRQPTDVDLDSAELTAELRPLPLRDLDAAALGVGRLQGPHVNVLGYGYDTSLSGPDFDVTRADPRFEGLMAYAHLDRFQRYLQALGFRGKAAVHPHAVDVLPGGAKGVDNAFYLPGSDLIVLGDGGVDDGEDAEIILHEYGHAVQYAQVPLWGGTTEGSAMGEGFGDFQAAAYFARTSGGFGDTCVADWDATSYGRGAPPCLRRIDGSKTYPQDMRNDPHVDGEIWSAFLWQVRAGLPGDAVAKSDSALRLVIASHALLTGEAGFADAVAALRTTAVALRQPSWVKVIDRAAGQRGIPLSP